MTERFTFDTSDGETLEARWDSPDDPRAVVVFCHPHPLQGGSMMAPLMIAVTTRLVEHGFSVLRFNFRGTGESTGTHDYGESEQLDITSAVEQGSGRSLPLGIAGWSFGAGTVLRWMAGQPNAVPYVGIAPPPDGLPEKLPSGPKRIIAGTRDQVVDIDLLRRYAESQSIDLVLTAGDHFFHGRGEKIGRLVAQGFEA